MFGENGFGMELHTVGLMFTMFESHDLFFGRDGSDFELGRDGVVDNKRVIAHGFERRRDAFENTFSVVGHFGGFAVHETLGTIHFAAEDGAEGLMSEANTEHGNFAVKCLMASDEIPSSLRGSPGPGEMTRWDGLSVSNSFSVTWSLRKTLISAPSSPKYWTRL